MSSKAIKSLIRYSALGIMLTLMYSCTREPFSEGWTEDTEGMIRVGLYTNAEDYQTPVSRASANEGYDDSASLPWVFVFTGNDDNAEFAEVKQAAAFGTLPCVMLTPCTSTVKLLIVANAPQTFFNGTGEVPFTADNLNAALTGKNFTAAVNTILNTPKLISPVSTVPYVVPQLYIPMSGVYDIPGGISATTTIGTSDAKLNLTRIAAKVTVESSALNFSLSSASVAGTNWYGRLYQTSPVTGMTGNSAINYAENIVAAAGSAGAQNTLENPIYIYESVSGQTSVIIKGVYSSNTYYYKLAFKDPIAGSIMAVERNKWYQFKITSVSGAGCASFAEAAAGSPSNVITAEIKVIDQGSYDLTDNGQYYIGLSNSALEIFSDKGIDYEFTAVIVTTDATQALIKGTNSISISGTGLLSCSPTSLNLGSGATPVATEIKIKTKTNATAELGEITIKLGNIIKVIPIRNAGSNVPASLSTVTGASGLFTSACVDPASSSWLSLVVNGTNRTEFTNPAQNSSVSFDLKTELNIGSGTTRRVGTAYITNTNSGRTKYYVVQNAVDMNTVTQARISNGYVGTFHRWDQTGERVIRMSNSGSNAWSAVVMAGDFIILDTETLGRTNTNDNTALSGADAENYKITGNATGVSGSGSRIYFRVGMTGKLPGGSAAAAPRYGVILVTYNNNTRYHLIYVRQGEAADFVMRNIPEDNPLTGPMAGVQRTLAARFSPYNLTDPAGSSGTRVGSATGTKYSFTAYPSQAGYFFQYHRTYAWSPDLYQFASGIWNGDDISSAVWTSSWESCPSGWHRPADGILTAHVPTTSPSTTEASELRQSLFLNPQDDPTGNTDNAVWGYLADGFFDRGSIESSLTGTSNSTVGSGTVDVAYIGQLFYNPNNYASVFFPSAGYRSTSSGFAPLYYTGGSTGSGYWTTTSASSTSTWTFDISSTTPKIGTKTKSSGSPIRCVKDN